MLEISCTSCGGLSGAITQEGIHFVLRCERCGKHQKNVSKSDVGVERRTVSTTRPGINPKLRASILLRANSRCEMCGASGFMNVAHLISVAAGLSAGMTTPEINDPDNLACMCEECNIGLGAQVVPLRLAIKIVQARIRNRVHDQ